MSSRPDMTLAQRKRQLVAGELTESALQLLAGKGFDAVTIDEIATAAGVSKRTFFRYFASKEDVVVQFLADMGTGIRAELAARPQEEPPSTALRHAVWVPLAQCADHGDRALRVVRLILGTPSLHARFLERQAQWREDLAEELAERLGLDAGTDFYPGMAAGMALNAFDAVLRRGSGSGSGVGSGCEVGAGSGVDEGDSGSASGSGSGSGPDADHALDVLLDRAFAVIAPALDAGCGARA